MAAIEEFLKAPTTEQWQKIGVKKRAGVATPLFSLYSQSSIGIGEIPDLKLLADWCVQTGMSIIQLLPLNDTGFKFTPYDAQSTLALDPMYLAVEKIKEANVEPFKEDLNRLKKQFPCGKEKVNYAVKGEKLKLLWQIFQGVFQDEPEGFKTYRRQNRGWLEDFCIFKVIKELRSEAGWEQWETGLKLRDPAVIEAFSKKHKKQIDFQAWLQWQLYLQLKEAKQYANQKGVILLGDLPFLVSRDSADVWSHQDYFKLDRLAGAPPDLYFAGGQRWGMPPYNWPVIEKHNYDYLVTKLKYAENFYDMFRIDHAVGLFRIWTIAMDEPAETEGRNGVFDPSDESTWEAHGVKLIRVMLENTGMLPCAEDLGVVPECSYKVLREYSIPGMDVQRWTKHWEIGEFKDPAQYRPNSVAVISTHDMSALKGWWFFEADTIDEILFKRHCENKGISFDAVKGKLFDLKESHYGRLRWRGELSDQGKMLWELGLPEQNAWEFMDLYHGAYSEREKFLNYIFPSGLDSGVRSNLLELNPKKVTVQNFSFFVKAVLQKANETASVFSIQLLQDWLSVSGKFPGDPWLYRINVPGTMSDKNWSLVMPWPLEEILQLPLNSEIRKINQSTSRC